MDEGFKEIEKIFNKLIEEPELGSWSRFGTLDEQIPHSRAS